MFRRPDDSGFKDVLDKIRQKTLVYGEKTLLAEFRLEQGPFFPSTPIPTSRPAIWLPAVST